MKETNPPTPEKIQKARSHWESQPLSFLLSELEMRLPSRESDVVYGPGLTFKVLVPELLERCKRIFSGTEEASGPLFDAANYTGGVAEIERMYSQLTEAAQIMGGLAQPRMSTEEPATPDEEEYDRGLERRRDALVTSLVVALGAEHLLRNGNS